MIARTSPAPRTPPRKVRRRVIAAKGKEPAIPPRPLQLVRRDFDADTKVGAVVPSREVARTRCMEFSELHGRLSRTTEFARRELKKNEELAKNPGSDEEPALVKEVQNVRNDQDTVSSRCPIMTCEHFVYYKRQKGGEQFKLKAFRPHTCTREQLQLLCGPGAMVGDHSTSKQSTSRVLVVSEKQDGEKAPVRRKTTTAMTARVLAPIITPLLSVEKRKGRRRSTVSAALIKEQLKPYVYDVTSLGDSFIKKLRAQAGKTVYGDIGEDIAAAQVVINLLREQGHHAELHTVDATYQREQLLKNSKKAWDLMDDYDPDKDEHLQRMLRLLEDKGEYFFGLSVCLEGTERMIDRIQGVIQVDATHANVGGMDGHWYFFVGSDARNQHVLLSATFLVANESKKSWQIATQFMQTHLKMDTPDFCIISDRDKGLIYVVDSMFHQAKNLYCRRHMQQNMQANGVGNSQVGFFLAACETNLIGEVNQYRNEFSSKMRAFLTKGGVLDRPEIMFKAVNGGTWGKMTSAGVESLNSMHLPGRFSHTLTQALLNIMDKEMERRSKFKKEGEDMRGEPREREKELEALRALCDEYKYTSTPIDSTGRKFRVTKAQDAGSEYAVELPAVPPLSDRNGATLSKRKFVTCTCRRPQIEKKLCVHVYACLSQHVRLTGEPSEYHHPILSAEGYRWQYEKHKHQDPIVASTIQDRMKAMDKSERLLKPTYAVRRGGAKKGVANKGGSRRKSYLEKSAIQNETRKQVRAERDLKAEMEKTLLEGRKPRKNRKMTPKAQALEVEAENKAKKKSKKK